MDITYSSKTALTRSKPSRPIKWLLSECLVKGRTLDYGCGHGFDADHYGFDKYDPFYFPKPPTGEYHTIVSNYVANTLLVYDLKDYLLDIKRLLKPKGSAYITVRRDIISQGKTSRGYQFNHNLNLKSIKLLKNNYEIYIMNK